VDEMERSLEAATGQQPLKKPATRRTRSQCGLGKGWQKGKLVINARVGFTR
jgi:hypothetical protein